MNKLFLSILSLLSASVFSFAGGDEKNKSPMPSPANTLVENGNNLLKKGEFSAAIAIWTEVLRQDADNSNANFKMGMCWYNSIDESPKALPFRLRRDISRRG